MGGGEWTQWGKKLRQVINQLYLLGKAFSSPGFLGNASKFSFFSQLRVTTEPMFQSWHVPHPSFSAVTVCSQLFRFSSGHGEMNVSEGTTQLQCTCFYLLISRKGVPHWRPSLNSITAIQSFSTSNGGIACQHPKSHRG